MMIKFFMIAALCGFCSAAESQIAGPQLGYMYDRQSAVVRPILGIPGSALFGPPLASELRNAVVSPSQDFAIGIFGDDSTVGILNFASAKLSLLKGASPAPTRIVVSPNGTAAAIVTGTRVQLFFELPGNPTAGTEFDLPAEPAALAVSDDGGLVLAAIAESDATGLYAYNKSAAAHHILTSGKIRAIEFLNHSHDAIFADELENKITLLRDATGVTLIANVEAPTALAAALDNRTIFVASSASQTITSISLDDGTAVSTACNCEPVTLSRLQGGAAFRITDRGDSPAWIFDTGGTEPRVLFIPQARGSNE